MFIEIILIQHFLLLLLNTINTYNYKTFFFVILCVRARVSVKGRCIEKLYVLLLDTYVCIECFFDWNVYVKTNIACNFWYIFLTISRLCCTRVYIKIKSLTMLDDNQIDGQSTIQSYKYLSYLVVNTVRRVRNECSN